MPFKYNALLGLGLDNTIPLDGAGKIPSTFLPSYVDDVEEYNNLAAFPATGETGKIYVAIDTGFAYRWSGSVYVQIGITAAAVATTQVQFNDAGAFAGDAGLTYDKSTDALTSGSLSVTSAGAAATPSLTFTGDPNTGIYSPGADQLAISTGGTARLTSSTTALTSALPIDVPLGAAATPSLTFTGDLNTGIYSPGADQLALSTAGNGRLFIDGTGFVGIGTVPTLGYALDVRGLARLSTVGGASGLEIGTGTATNQFATLDLVGDATYTDYGLRLLRGNSGANAGSNIAHKGTGALSLVTEEAAPITLATNNAERVRIDSSGRLLVGTGSDSGGALFQVNGDRIRVGTAKTPATSGATGTTGEIAWDADYIYVCTATNTWKRSAIATW